MKRFTINKKKVLIYGGIFIGGLILGSLLFNGNGGKEAKTAVEHEHKTARNDTTWTCSMHPQIQKDEPGNCPICGMELIPLQKSSEGESLSRDQFKMTKEAVKLANIQTSEVNMSKPDKTLHLQGQIKEDERRISLQSAHFAGRIEKLYVSYKGEKVTKGQKLAVIYSPKLVSAQKELFEALEQKEEYPQLLRAARNKLKLWKLSEEQIRRIEKSGKIKEKFTVNSDVSGYVTQRNVSVGDYVETGDPLFKIVDLGKVWALFDAYQKDLPFIHTGDHISFRVEGVPDKHFTGKVTYIDPVMNSKTRVASVRTVVNNYDHQLKPGMFARGTLEASLNYQRNALVIPHSAVMWTGKRSIVYVKVPEVDYPLFELRKVTLGEDLGSHHVIEKGLEKGEEVVTHGTFTVDAAAQLNNKYSMMNPPMKEQTKQYPDYSGQATRSFNTSLQEALKDYLLLTESLVAADATNAAKEAQNLLQNIKAIHTEKLQGKAGEFARKKLHHLKMHTKAITETQSIDAQRKEFKPLSAAMIALGKSFNIKREKLYIKYCPMADNDKGALWLSQQKQISNPYYGDMMLRCGEVRDSIEGMQKN